MDYIVIEGVRPYDGRYEFDLAQAELTTREWGWIKRLSGYLPLTIEEGLSDPELITVFALIALHRAGKIETRDAPAVFESMLDAPFGSRITLDAETVDEEEAAGEPDPPQLRPSSSGDITGPGSTRSSEISAGTPEPSGMPASDISLFHPARSAT